MSNGFWYTMPVTEIIKVFVLVISISFNNNILEKVLLIIFIMILKMFSENKKQYLSNV